MSRTLQDFTAHCQKTIPQIIAGLDPAALTAAADLIDESMAQGGRLHITGIGKPSYVAGYAASLFSSTGTPAYYLHGTEAVHGS